MVLISERKDDANSQNYRPSGLTSIERGMLESIVADGIGEDLVKHDLVCS